MSELRSGTYLPDQCCNGYCVPVLPEDDEYVADDGLLHDLRADQATRLSELLDRMDAHARTDVPALLAEVERLTAELRESVVVGEARLERARTAEALGAACGSDELAKADARAGAAERQVHEIRRVIAALRETDDPTSEYRRMLGDWLDAALAGDLDPDDVRSRIHPATPTTEEE